MDLSQSTMELLHNALKSIITPNGVTFGRMRTRSHTRTTVQSLPNELLLEIFSFLELKPYLISYGVCKKWRRLLPSTELDPIRERLLCLYYRILDTPDFQRTLEWTDHNLQPFDREAYIASLLEQYTAIPGEYRMWILEWPARLVIQCTWPGLPFINCQTVSRIVRRSGVNWIAYEPTSPRLLALIYKFGTPSQMFIPGLFIWRDGNSSNWLIFEKDEPDLFGRVFYVDANLLGHMTGSIPFFPPRDEDTDTEYWMSEGEEFLQKFDDWIEYLEDLWDQTIDDIRRPSATYIRPDVPIIRPISYWFNGPGPTLLPALMWDSYRSTIDTIGSNI